MMGTEAQSAQSEAPRKNSVTTSVSLVTRWPMIVWLLALPLMLTGIGTPEVSRTQEARVLETARQMLGKPSHDWLIPKLNGDVRLQKPPLTYWMTAAAYKLFGVSEGAGRVPTA